VSLKTLFTLIAPGALILTAAGVLLLYSPTDLAVQASRGYPLVALAVAVLLAWRMHRSRVLVAALLLLATHAALSPQQFSDDVLMTSLAAMMLPLLMAAVAFTSDRHVAGRFVASQIFVVASLIAAAVLFLFIAPGDAQFVLMYPLIDQIYTSWARLEQVPLIAAALGMLTLTAIALFRGKAIDAGLAWATLAGVLAITSPATTAARGVWMLAAGLVLVIALVESFYLMAFHDELTGLPARRALSQTLSALRPPYTVAIVDVDHFKTFNDRYGHDVGDEVLRMVATRLAAVTGGGRAYRSGGEEFTIVFPGKEKSEALPHVEQVREAVADAKFTLRKLPRPTKADGERKRKNGGSNQRQIGVTISVGLAGVGVRNPTTAAVVKAADSAMYRAKKGGRNRVVA
jgi:diguanylate cyclase (GGDEF)-like protein